MGWVTFYNCLINRKFDDIENFRTIVDEFYFERCLMSAAETAFVNGMGKEELQEVVRRYLGVKAEERFERVCEYYEKAGI